MNRKDVIKTARTVIKSCATKEDVINAGLMIAACRHYSPRFTPAKDCVKIATDLINRLIVYYPTNGRLVYLLEDLVKRRAWAALWTVAESVAYPHAYPITTDKLYR